jgi:hypothetical protein
MAKLNVLASYTAKLRHVRASSLNISRRQVPPHSSFSVFVRRSFFLHGRLCSSTAFKRVIISVASSLRRAACVCCW